MQIGSAGGTVNYRHAPFMLLIFAALITGMWAGLVRIGWQLPVLHDDFALAHGSLMVSGFLGTLINLERAVALYELLKTTRFRYLPYLPALLSAAGAIAIVIDLSFAALLMTLSSLGMVLMFGYIVYIQTAIYSLAMAMGALAWLAGNAVWLGGEPLYMSAPWWMAFLILTIAGERLELARIMRHARRSVYLFAGAVGILLFGLAYGRLQYDLGMRLFGVGNISIALWLLRYDVVHRTIRRHGLPRFVAVCLTLGYVWLIISGVMAVSHGGVKVGMIYDAILHAVFLGFAFSMIFGHAPIIFPSVIGLGIRYSSSFYAHLSLLHLSLIVRVGGDVFGWADVRRWGAMLNALVLLFFVVNMIRTLQTAEAKPVLPQTRLANVTYAVALPLFVIGFILIGVGFAAVFQEDDQLGYGTGPIAAGERLYQATCAACHGTNLRGIPGIGKNLIDSPFVAGQSDAELREFIKHGRPIWDAANTTGIDMPPRGGNPALTDAEIDHIIMFIRQEASQ